LIEFFLVATGFIRGCLHGHGDYVLSNANKHYFVPDEVWRCKTKEEKVKIFTNFMKDNRKKRTAGMMTSTDGAYSVINKAKKPYQRKRPC
jgi:hypothetical protein